MEMGDSSSRVEREYGVDLCCVRGRAEIALGMMMRRWRRRRSRRSRRRGRVGSDMLGDYCRSFYCLSILLVL